MKLENINGARALAMYLRNRIDDFSGQEFSVEFVNEIRGILSSPRHRKMMFKGSEFSATLQTVLREFRVVRLQEVVNSILGSDSLA